MKKNLIIIYLFAALYPKVHASKAMNNMLMPKGKLAFYTPVILNPKYFSFSFSFLTRKKLSRNYHFNAFAGIFLAEESFTTNDDIRAGALGFKGGVLLPTQPWVPLYFQFSFGYAKTVLHREPWFGKKDQSFQIKDMLMVETGILFKWKQFLLRYVFQINTTSYFKKKNFISIGANF